MVHPFYKFIIIIISKLLLFLLLLRLCSENYWRKPSTLKLQCVSVKFLLLRIWFLWKENKISELSKSKSKVLGACEWVPLEHRPDYYFQKLFIFSYFYVDKWVTLRNLVWYEISEIKLWNEDASWLQACFILLAKTIVSFFFIFL